MQPYFTPSAQNIHPTIQKQKRKYDPSASAPQRKCVEYETHELLHSIRASRTIRAYTPHDPIRKGWRSIRVSIAARSKSTREIKSLHIRRIRRLHSHPHYNSWQSHPCSPTPLHSKTKKKAWSIRIYTPWSNKKRKKIHPRQHHSKKQLNQTKSNPYSLLHSIHTTSKSAHPCQHWTKKQIHQR